MAVYLLHFTNPLIRANGEKVQHYLGFVNEGGILRRLDEHRRGRNTTPLVRALLANNSEIKVGGYWPGKTRDDERRMKTAGHLPAKCAICRAEAAIAAIPRLEA